MRKIPEKLPEEGLLVGWSLEPGHRKSIIGFRKAGPEFSSPALSLEPILDTGEGHLVTVAPTGAGKGTGCIIPALLRYTGPVVVVDPKGENYAVTAERRREMGQEVVLLDPFNITGEEVRHRFNPLDLTDPSSERFVEDVATLAALIAAPNENAVRNDYFWNTMGRALVSAAIIDVLTMYDSENATLPAVRNLINSPIGFLKERSEKWQTSDNYELKQLTGILHNPADETLGGYIAYAINHLDFLKGDQMTEHLSSSDLDLNRIYDGSPMSVYLVLPPDKLESHSSLLRLWIGTIITVITRRRKQPSVPTLLLIDEAAQLGTLPQLRQAITLLRGYGVRVWTFWQDISQLRNLYPNDWETILNNCRVQQYFGATTGIAAQAISHVSGFGTEHEVKDLEADELILNIAGDEPVIAAKPNYLWDPPFQGLYRDNPYYADMKTEEERVAQIRPVYRKTSSPAKKKRAKTLRQESILANRIFNPVQGNCWERISGEERERCLELAGIKNPGFINDPSVQISRCSLPFYKDYNWYEIKNTKATPDNHAYYIMSSEESRILNGESDVLHKTNDEFIELTQSNVLLYMKFFCTNIHGQGGRFLVLETADDIEWSEPPDTAFLADLKDQILPPRIKSYVSDNGSSHWIIESEILYETAIFNANITVYSSGIVTMDDDTPIAGDLPVIQDITRLKYIGSFDEEGGFTPLR